MKESLNEKFYSFLEKCHIENNMNIQRYAKNIHGNFRNEDYYALLLMNSEKVVLKKFLRYFHIGSLSKGNVLNFFTDFEYLSKYLLLSGLNPKECRILVFEVIQRNIRDGLLDGHKMMVDLDGMEKYTFQFMDVKEAERLLIEMNQNILNEDIDGNYDIEDRMKRIELRRFLKEHSIDISELMECHRIIQLHYFSKIGKYNDVDIEEIKNALYGLGICEELCDSIEGMLQSNYQKRVWSSSPISIDWKGKKNDKVTYLSDKEYKAIRKELKLYCDLYRNCGIRYLDEEERMRCISLLMSLGMTDGDIEQLLRRIDWNYPGAEPQYSIEEYSKMYSKILYDEKKYRLEESIRDLNDDINAMMITDDMEYSFWKEEFSKNFKILCKKIDFDYGYELENVRKKCKK